MRLRGGLILGVGAAGLAVACGLEVVGSSTSAPVLPTEGADAAEPPPLDLGSGGEAAFDASLPDETPSPPAPVDAGPCGATALVENFASGLGSWSTYGGTVQGVSGNNAYARLIAEGDDGRAAGLFWLPTVKATAFKARFTYYVATPYQYWYMGDGLTFTWLTSMGAAALGTGAISGQALGLQPGVTGFSFALDGWKNDATNDLDDPSFAILKIDPSRGDPGGYDWHVAKKGPYRRDDVYDNWRTIEVVVGNGKVSASFQFTPTGTATALFTDVPIDTSANIQAIGFTAGTGGADAMGFFVDTASFELIGATCN
ncbi:MAG: hypothetical protein K0S65_1344 [Labilithrix sp.]|nr:hypothetical protein [Labilithrix sp.]